MLKSNVKASSMNRCMSLYIRDGMHTFPLESLAFYSFKIHRLVSSVLSATIYS